MTLLAIALLLGAAGTDLSLFSMPVAARYDDALVIAAPSLASQLGVLSAQDAQYYRMAFDAQHQGHFAQADALAKQAQDPLLLGELLGERYTAAGYKASYDELAQWLAHYSDYPQAKAVYRLAVALNHTNDELADAPVAQTVLEGFSNGNDRSQLHSEPYAKDWNAGLNAFRKDDMAVAAKHFQAILHNKEKLPDADYAAVAFWTYRTLKAQGNDLQALHYAQEAANQPPSFYSILARGMTGQQQAASEAGASSLQQVAPLLEKNAVRRVVALKEAGQDMLAEHELRTLFPSAQEDDRKKLVALAGLLSLPAAQMRMALADADNTQVSEAYYPMPRWTPTAGYRIAPSLLFAIMRQESGFNPNARSASGALGVMQLMPATASAMARSERLSALSSKPSVSMALGQSYLEHLMGRYMIGDNLVFLTAAYNAGPGAVINWEHKLHYNNDPLLFIESIPFSQTRDYVVHVMGNYWVYSQLLGGYDASVAAVSSGQWPRYARTDKELASMLDRLGSD
jgi:soluble lytic murein transglycosylase-like protein